MKLRTATIQSQIKHKVPYLTSKHDQQAKIKRISNRK